MFMNWVKIQVVSTTIASVILLQCNDSQVDEIWNMAREFHNRIPAVLKCNESLQDLPW